MSRLVWLEISLVDSLEFHFSLIGSTSSLSETEMGRNPESVQQRTGTEHFATSWDRDTFKTWDYLIKLGINELHDLA